MTKTAAGTSTRKLTARTPGTIRYSICTCVVRPALYAQFRTSFQEKGFAGPDCEYLVVDNSIRNQMDGYEACNRFLQEALGDYIILVHEDVVAVDDARDKLDRVLGELSKLDRHWAVAGNAGTNIDGALCGLFTDGNGRTSLGPFPAEVIGLDENFMVIRRDANLAVSPLLHGFHLYGTELCVMAAALGMKSYVLDFHVAHNAIGHKSTQTQPFNDSVQSFTSLRSHLLRPTAHGAAYGLFFVSRWAWLNRLLNGMLATRWRSALFRGLRVLKRVFP